MSALLSIVLSAFSVFAPHPNGVYDGVQTMGSVSSNLTTVHTNGVYDSVQGM